MKNTGNISGTVSVTSNNGFTNFQVDTSSCGASLLPGATCTAVISIISPINGSTYDDIFHINGNDVPVHASLGSPSLSFIKQ